MIALLLAAQLNIGVYYTFPAETITLHNRTRTSKVKIERQSFNIEADIKKMLKEAQDLINKAVFDGRETIVLKPKFVRYWQIENPPVYRDENIFYAIDLDAIWPDFMALTNVEENQADISLLLFASDIAHFNEVLGGKKRASGFYRLGMIVLANYNSAGPAMRYSLTLDHEIGHYLNLEHADAEECKKIYYVMCATISSHNTVFDESLKKAWRDFYEARTGQKFEDMLSK